MISNEEDRAIYRAPLVPWLFPTKAAAARAWRIADIGASGEAKRAGELDVISDAQARAAIVNGRQDIAALFVLQLACHKQLVNISRGVWVVVFLAWGIWATIGSLR